MQGLSTASRLRRLARDWAQPAMTFVALLLLWEASGRVFGVPIWLLPTPMDIVHALVERGSDLFLHTWITFYETIFGFLLAIALGVPLAVAVTHSRALSNTIYPLILVTQSVPKVAFAPILLIWFGGRHYTDETKANGVGYMSQAGVQKTIDVLREYMGLKAGITPDETFDMSFLPKKGS
jgi:ABC-type nitrate/sulfonate/bicarbonate transport system permease component